MKANDMKAVRIALVDYKTLRDKYLAWVKQQGLSGRMINLADCDRHITLETIATDTLECGGCGTFKL